MEEEREEPEQQQPLERLTPQQPPAPHPPSTSPVSPVQLELWLTAPLIPIPTLTVPEEMDPSSHQAKQKQYPPPETVRCAVLDTTKFSLILSSPSRTTESTVPVETSETDNEKQRTKNEEITTVSSLLVTFHGPGAKSNDKARHQREAEEETKGVPLPFPDPSAICTFADCHMFSYGPDVYLYKFDKGLPRKYLTIPGAKILPEEEAIWTSHIGTWKMVSESLALSRAEIMYASPSFSKLDCLFDVAASLRQDLTALVGNPDKAASISSLSRYFIQEQLTSADRFEILLDFNLEALSDQITHITCLQRLPHREDESYLVVGCANGNIYIYSGTRLVFSMALSELGPLSMHFIGSFSDFMAVCLTGSGKLVYFDCKQRTCVVGLTGSSSPSTTSTPLMDGLPPVDHCIFIKRVDGTACIVVACLRQLMFIDLTPSVDSRVPPTFACSFQRQFPGYIQSLAPFEYDGCVGVFFALDTGYVTLYSLRYAIAIWSQHFTDISASTKLTVFFGKFGREEHVLLCLAYPVATPLILKRGLDFREVEQAMHLRTKRASLLLGAGSSGGEKWFSDARELQPVPPLASPGHRGSMPSPRRSLSPTGGAYRTSTRAKMNLPIELKCEVRGDPPYAALYVSIRVLDLLLGCKVLIGMGNEHDGMGLEESMISVPMLAPSCPASLRIPMAYTHDDDMDIGDGNHVKGNYSMDKDDKDMVERKIEVMLLHDSSHHVLARQFVVLKGFAPRY